MEWFKINGTSSNDLGIVIKDIGAIPTALRNIETVSVNGRNGNLHIDNGNYEQKTITIKCIVTDLSKIDTLKAKLQGVFYLERSVEEGRIYKAKIKNQIDFVKYLVDLKEFPIQLIMDPIAYSKTLTTEVITSNGSIIVGGNVETPPTVVVTGTGTFTINGYSVTTSEDGITIDCDLMNCTKDSLNKNSAVTLDSFPVLTPGNNAITLGTGITKLVITYKAGWL